MKITKTKLVEIIKEELEAALEEKGFMKDMKDWDEYFEAAKAEGATDEEAEEYANKMLKRLKDGYYSEPLPAGDDDDLPF